MRRVAVDMDESLVIPPSIEPLDIEEIRKQRRFGPTSQDTLYDLWNSASRQHFEEQTGRQILKARWVCWLACFPLESEIELPHPPLLEVISVAYDDGDGVEQTLDASSYTVIAPAGPYCRRGRIKLNSGASWPSTATHPKAVRILFDAGYGSAPGDVPEIIRAALFFLVGHFDKYREEVQESGDVLRIPLGAKSIMDAFRYSALPQVQATRWDICQV